MKFLRGEEMYRGDSLIRNRYMYFEDTRLVSSSCFLLTKEPTRDWQSPGSDY